MASGNNSWGVRYSRITFMETVLSSHNNVVSFDRELDILFRVKRRKQEDTLRILCADEYAFGLTFVQRALVEFGHLQIISVGGAWNGYTPEAKEYCLKSRIGLYNSKELPGGLWHDEYWKFHLRDEDGAPIYSYKREY